MITCKCTSLRYIDLYEKSISYDKEKSQPNDRSWSPVKLPIYDISICTRYRFDMTRRNVVGCVLLHWVSTFSKYLNFEIFCEITQDPFGLRLCYQKNIKFKAYRNIILHVFCVGVKHGSTSLGRNVGWVCLRIERWGEYLGLRGTR